MNDEEGCDEEVFMFAPQDRALCAPSNTRTAHRFPLILLKQGSDLSGYSAAFRAAPAGFLSSGSVSLFFRTSYRFCDSTEKDRAKAPLFVIQFKFSRNWVVAGTAQPLGKASEGRPFKGYGFGKRYDTYMPCPADLN
ncbi:hypothetical protein YQE_08241, partial [Dendroctonus ponderosae]